MKKFQCVLLVLKQFLKGRERMCSKCGYGRIRRTQFSFLLIYWLTDMWSSASNKTQHISTIIAISWSPSLVYVVTQCLSIQAKTPCFTKKLLVRVHVFQRFQKHAIQQQRASVVFSSVLLAFKALYNVVLFNHSNFIPFTSLFTVYTQLSQCVYKNRFLYGI